MHRPALIAGRSVGPVHLKSRQLPSSARISFRFDVPVAFRPSTLALPVTSLAHITDRIKDMYIYGGFNCYPAEIENLIYKHPGIAQVA